MYATAGAWFSQMQCRSILDLGCGDGILLRHFQDFDHYYGVDVSTVALDRHPGIYDDRCALFNRDLHFLIDATTTEFVPRVDGLFLGGILYYESDPLAFVKAVVSMCLPRVVVIQDLNATNLLPVMEAYPVHRRREFVFPELPVSEIRQARQLLAIMP